MSQLKRPRILIVEDEQSLKLAIERKLNRSGFDTYAMSTAEEAVELLKDENNKPDIIWLDYYLPSMNGLELLGLIKKDQKLRDVPVFVISNTAGPEKVSSMMALGVDKYYIKAEKRLDDIILEMKKLLKQKKDK